MLFISNRTRQVPKPPVKRQNLTIALTLNPSPLCGDKKDCFSKPLRLSPEGVHFPQENIPNIEVDEILGISECGVQT